MKPGFGTRRGGRIHQPIYRQVASSYAGDDVDAVSGATVTSQAVVDARNSLAEQRIHPKSKHKERMRASMRLHPLRLSKTFRRCRRGSLSDFSFVSRLAGFAGR